MTTPIDTTPPGGSYIREWGARYAFGRRLAFAPMVVLDGDALTVERAGDFARAHRAAGRGVPLHPVKRRRQPSIAELIEDTADPVKAGPHGDLHDYLANLEEPTC